MREESTCSHCGYSAVLGRRCLACGAGRRAGGERRRGLEQLRDRGKRKQRRGIELEPISGAAVRLLLAPRGMTREIAEKYNAFETSQHPGYLMFPILGPGGAMLTYHGRRIDDAAEHLPKWWSPPPSEGYAGTHAVLWGGHTLQARRPAWVVEGIFDAIAMIETSYTQHPVASQLGPTLFPRQARFLASRDLGTLKIVLDRDAKDESLRVCRRNMRMAQRALPLKVRRWGDLGELGKDPGSLLGLRKES